MKIDVTFSPGDMRKKCYGCIFYQVEDALRVELAEIEETKKDLREQLSRQIDLVFALKDDIQQLEKRLKESEMTRDALKSYSDFYDQLLNVMGMSGYLPGQSTDDKILMSIIALQAASK
jgi:hypothetical protein